MADAIADKHLESSAISLNRQSWPGDREEEERTKDNTPLLKKREKRWSLSNDGKAVGKGTSASYSTLLDPERERRKGLFVSRTVFGEVRNCQRLTWVEWLFIVVSAFTMMAIAAMSVERFIFIHNSFSNVTPDDPNVPRSGSGDTDQVNCLHWSCLNDFTFAVLGLLNLIFCVYYCYDGLLRERPFEIIGFAFTIFILTTYIIVNYFVEGEQGDMIKLIRLVSSFILGPLNIVLSVVVQHRMGFLVLNTIGSNQTLTRAYHSRSLFLTIQTYNIQILANIMVLSWVKAGHFTGLGEKVILPLLIVCMVGTSYLGWAAVLWEIKPMVMVWCFLASFSIGYYIFKIVNVGVHWSYYREVYTEFYTDGLASARTHFLYIAIIILFSCVLGMLVGVVMTVLMVTVLGNFGKGLKERIPPPCCPESTLCCPNHSKTLTDNLDYSYS